MRPRVWLRTCAVALALATSARSARALPPVGRVRGLAAPLQLVRASDATVVARAATLAELQTLAIAPGRYTLEATVAAPSATFVEVPECLGRGPVTVDGATYAPPHGTFAVRVAASATAHTVRVPVAVTGYEGRVACSSDVLAGALELAEDGLRTLSFPSPEPGGGQAVLYVPRGHRTSVAGPLLVGLHPWGGDAWTYASAGELLRAADAHGVPLLMPSGLGNSLYTARAEREAMRAIAAATAAIAVDPERVSVWGASMGGAGATTIAFHRPDRFAVVASFFGDSRYDLSTYARAILPTPAAAHAVNALDVAPNARHLLVRLFHGDADTVSPIAQSEMLARDLSQRGFDVRFERVPGRGHSGRLVAERIDAVVREAASARTPTFPARVSYVSAREEDVGAYGVRLVRKRPGDARVDLAFTGGAIHVEVAENVGRLVLDRRALGSGGPRAVVDDAKSGVSVAWE